MTFVDFDFLDFGCNVSEDAAVALARPFKVFEILFFKFSPSKLFRLIGQIREHFTFAVGLGNGVMGHDSLEGNIVVRNVGLRDLCLVEK